MTGPSRPPTKPTPVGWGQARGTLLVCHSSWRLREFTGNDGNACNKTEPGMHGITFIVREGRGIFRRGRSRRGVHKGCSRRGGHKGCSRRGGHSRGCSRRRRQVELDCDTQLIRRQPGGRGQGSTAMRTARAAITTARQGRQRRPLRKGGHHNREGGHNSCQCSHNNRNCMRNGI